METFSVERSPVGQRSTLARNRFPYPSTRGIGIDNGVGNGNGNGNGNRNGNSNDIVNVDGDGEGHCVAPVAADSTARSVCVARGRALAARSVCVTEDTPALLGPVCSHQEYDDCDVSERPPVA